MIRNSGPARLAARGGRARGVALVIVLGVLALFTSIAAGIIATTGLEQASSQVELLSLQRGNCREEGLRFLMENLSDSRILGARNASSGACYTMISINMDTLSTGDVPAASGQEDPLSCTTGAGTGGNANMCDAGEKPCSGANAALGQQILNQRAREQQTFTDSSGTVLNSLPYDRDASGAGQDGVCSTVRGIMSIQYPVTIQQIHEVGEDAGVGAGAAGSCKYFIRAFSMVLPQNDRRFYSNYLDTLYSRIVYSTLRCFN